VREEGTYKSQNRSGGNFAEELQRYSQGYDQGARKQKHWICPADDMLGKTGSGIMKEISYGPNGYPLAKAAELLHGSDPDYSAYQARRYMMNPRAIAPTNGAGFSEIIMMGEYGWGSPGEILGQSNPYAITDSPPIWWKPRYQGGQMDNSIRLSHNWGKGLNFLYVVQIIARHQQEPPLKRLLRIPGLLRTQITEIGGRLGRNGRRDDAAARQRQQKPRLGFDEHEPGRTGFAEHARRQGVVGKLEGTDDHVEATGPSGDPLVEDGRGQPAPIILTRLGQGPFEFIRLQSARLQFLFHTVGKVRHFHGNVQPVSRLALESAQKGLAQSAAAVILGHDQDPCAVVDLHQVAGQLDAADLGVGGSRRDDLLALDLVVSQAAHARNRRQDGGGDRHGNRRGRPSLLQEQPEDDAGHGKEDEDRVHGLSLRIGMLRPFGLPHATR
jgi:hypothetical protein